MQYRLLTLDRTPDRLDRFKRRNRHVSCFEPVSAIDGSLADRGRLVANEVVTPDLDYTDGALGCGLSHLVQWRDAINTQQPLTVAEDDALLARNFQPELERTLASLDGSWDYVMWGWNFDARMTFDMLPGLTPCIAEFDQASLRRHADRFAMQGIETKLFPLLSGFGTICYSISPRGAAKLLNFCMPLRPMRVAYPGYAEALPNRGIDQMLAAAWPQLSAFVAIPPLVVTENVHRESTVQAEPAKPETAWRPVGPARTESIVCEVVRRPAGRTLAGAVS